MEEFPVALSFGARFRPRRARPRPSSPWAASLTGSPSSEQDPLASTPPPVSLPSPIRKTPASTSTKLSPSRSASHGSASPPTTPKSRSAPVPPRSPLSEAQPRTLPKNCEHKFEETARDPRFRFFGNVELVAPSSNPPVLSSLAAQVPLARLTPHYDAILLSYGASLSRPLPLPGSTLSYILPARSLVAWYNGHPSLSPGGALSPLSSTSPPGDIDLSKIETVTLIGQGNVALDLARLLLKPVDSLSTTDLPSPVLDALAKSRVRRVRIVGRRGPLQLAATTKEVRELMALPNVAFRVDHVQLHAAMRECEAHPGMQGARGKKRALEVMRKGSATKPGTEGAKEWSFEFFKSPLEFFGREGEEGRVGSVEWGVNELGPGKEGDDDPADFVARSTGRTVRDETDLVLTSVGYRSEEIPGIPFDARRGVVLNEGGRVLTAPAGEPVRLRDPFRDWEEKELTYVVTGTDKSPVRFGVARPRPDGRDREHHVRRVRDGGPHRHRPLPHRPAHGTPPGPPNRRTARGTTRRELGGLGAVRPRGAAARGSSGEGAGEDDERRGDACFCDSNIDPLEGFIYK